MALFKIDNQVLVALDETSFGAQGLLEKHIQDMLLAKIQVLDENLMVITKEFKDWLDSKRRIDLLCIDSDANLVVVELKNTDDGGHMELQALRYAAMVSAMTLDHVVETFARYVNDREPDIEAARSTIMGFLRWNESDANEFGSQTRIVLAAADFSKEITTTVLWLRESDIDIRCVRLKPYRTLDGAVILDIQQLIPLPEAEEFTIKLRAKKDAEKKTHNHSYELRTKFWQGLLECSNTKTALFKGHKAPQGDWSSTSAGHSGFRFTYMVRKEECQAELGLVHNASGQKTKNKAAFKALEAQRDAIESEFGAALDWQELPDSDICRIRFPVSGGYESPDSEWPGAFDKVTDAMIKLEAVMRNRVAALAVP